MKTALSSTFDQHSGAGSARSFALSKDAKPFSIRLTDDERAYLKTKAGRRPLGAYCREVLLADKSHKRRELRQPTIDDGQYAALLAALGHSHLSSNLNQLAKHANMGTLDVNADIEQQLQDAYSAVIEMRTALFMALGLKCGVDIGDKK